MDFTELEIKQEIVNSLKEQGIVTPTMIQEKAIPFIKQGRDVIGMSKTGSGKTATFGVPMLHNLDVNAGLQYLIVAPTRELAVQIANEMKKFGKYLKFRTATVFGGMAINPQMEAISSAHIVVGTPGRLIDHLQRRSLDLSKIKTVVLDEADKMVEMGFIEDIEYILGKAPPHRQILLFGATLSTEIDYLKKKYMHNSQEVAAETYVQEDFLKQYYYNVRMFEKFSLLVHLLKKEAIQKGIIFCSKISTVEVLTKNLRAQGIKAEMMHGKLTQNKRLRIMDEFNNKDKVDILVASAVAARGLDIKFVTHVFNYDLSQDPQEYVHRVGRTARAGESGKAITLLSENDFGVFGEILTRYRQLNIQEMPDENFQKIPFDPHLGREPRQRRNGFSRSNNNYSRSWGDRSNSSNSFGRDSRGPRSWNGPRRQGVESRNTRSPGRDQYAWNSGD